MEHLDDNAASEFVSGTLPPSAIHRIEGHLASCRDCRALVAALAVDITDDSNAITVRDDRLSVSQAAELPRRTLSIGDRVGRYLVLSSIGAGGMGVVFAAYDPQLDRKIALKLLRSGLAVSSKDARARLRREAQAIAQLSHPNVVSVYDVGTTEDGDVYIAMEFVEGDTLTSWLKKYPRTWREIIDVFVQAARGLLSAHRVGLLHRDFKPDNVLVGGDGRVRVTDFGLARSLLAPDDAAQAKPSAAALNVALTATGTVLGTPRYMPPEQLTGPDLDARSDQFSFCVALYEALYGCHPLRGGTAVSMLDHGDRALPPPEGLKIPAAIGRAVLRGLERDRARRFPSMGSLIDELVPSPRRFSVRYGALATVAILLAGGSVAAWVAQRPPAQPPAADSADAPGLREQLRVVEDDRRKLLVQLEQARADHATSETRLYAKLRQKDDEIEQLTVKIEQLGASNDKLVALVKRFRLGPPRTAAAIDALEAAQRAIGGCFFEWAERNQGTREEVSQATLVIGLTVTPDGIGTMPRILSTPDEHVPVLDARAPVLSVLEMCVSEQVARVRFPPGPERLELEVTFQWSPGRVQTSAKVVDRRMPLGRVELQ